MFGKKQSLKVLQQLSFFFCIEINSLHVLSNVINVYQVVLWVFFVKLMKVLIYNNN